MNKFEQLKAEKEILEEGIDLQKAYIETNEINLSNANKLNSQYLMYLYTRQSRTLKETLKGLKKHLIQKIADIVVYVCNHDHEA